MLGALPRMDAPLQVDEDRLAGRDVARQRVAGAFDRDRFARHHHGALPVGAAFAERQRPDAERVAERQQAVAGDQRDHRIRAADPPVHRAHRVEHRVGRQRQVARGDLELVRQHVEQHLGVALRVDVAAVDVEQLLLQHRGIRQVAVVHQHDAVRRVDVERLRLLLAVGVAGGRIAHLAEPDRAGQPAHVAGAKDVAHHAARLVHEALGALHRDDAGGILAAVLQQQQRVVDQLVDGRLRDDADDAAHGWKASFSSCAGSLDHLRCALRYSRWERPGVSCGQQLRKVGRQHRPQFAHRRIQPAQRLRALPRRRLRQRREADQRAEDDQHQRAAQHAERRAEQPVERTERRRADQAAAAAATPGSRRSARR